MKKNETSGTAKANQSLKLVCPKESEGSRCGGELEFTGRIDAGWPRGNFFYLYRCQKCKRIIAVGGK